MCPSKASDVGVLVPLRALGRHQMRLLLPTIYTDHLPRSTHVPSLDKPSQVHSRDELLRQKLLFAGAWLTLGTIRDEEAWMKAIVGGAGAVVVYVLYGMARGGAATLQSAKRKRVLREFGVKDE